MSDSEKGATANASLYALHTPLRDSEGKSCQFCLYVNHQRSIYCNSSTYLALETATGGNNQELWIWVKGSAVVENSEVGRLTKLKGRFAMFKVIKKIAENEYAYRRPLQQA